MGVGAVRECGHTPCRCPVAPGSDYCCEQCKNAFGTTDCECGHPECRAVAFREERNDAKNKV